MSECDKKHKRMDFGPERTMICDDPVKAKESLVEHIKKCHPYLFNESGVSYEWTPAGTVEKPRKPYDVFEDARMKALIDSMQPGDVINHYRTAPHTWAMLCGREGYELKRGDETLASVCTCLN